MRLSDIMGQRSPVLLDSAMGTELARHGIDISLPLWSARALLSAPHMVRNIHFWNLHAGADVLTANTFRTNPRTMRGADMHDRWEELTLHALEFAFEARERYRVWRPVCVAASIAPLEDCYDASLVPSDAELDDEHGRFAETLALAGAELLLGETIGSAREAAAIARAASATGREYAISFITGRDGRLLSGEPLEDAVAAVMSAPGTARPAPVCLLLNCIPATAIHDPLTVLRRATSLPVGCHANSGDPFDEQQPHMSIDEYSDAAVRWKALGADIIGGCCGTTPEHIAALHARFFPDADAETRI